MSDHHEPEDTSSVDIEDVIAAVRHATELVDVWLIDGDPATTSDRLRLWSALSDATGRREGSLPVALRTLTDRLAPDLDEAPVEVGGSWFSRRYTRTRKGYDRDALRAKANVLVLAPKDDRAPTTAEVLERVWRLADVATGRTKVWRDVGVDLDEFAAEAEWVASIEVVAAPEATDW